MKIKYIFKVGVLASVTSLVLSVPIFAMAQEEDVPAWARDKKSTSGAEKSPPPAKKEEQKGKEERQIRTKKLGKFGEEEEEKKEEEKMKEDEEERARKQAEQDKKRSKFLPEGKEEEEKKEKEKGKKGDWRKGTIYEGRKTISPASIINENNHIGMFFGPFLLRDRAFANISPNFDFHWWENGLSTGLHIPLNLEIVDASEPIKPNEPEKQLTENLFKLRKEDWDETSDYFKVIRYIKYGNKDDKLYFNLGSLSAYTIGHGTVVNRYVNTADFDHRKVGLQFDLAIQKDERDDYGGFQLFLSDITLGSQVFGLLLFGKPFVMSKSETLRSFSLGLHGTFDTNAPFHVVRNEDDFYRPTVNEETNELMFESSRITALGIDGVIKVVRTPNVDVKPYLDFTYMATKNTDGMGTTAGILNRFKLSDEPRLYMHLRGAGRFMVGAYIPAYFNTFYEIQKYQFFAGKNTLDICSERNAEGVCVAHGPPTKLEFMERYISGGRVGYEFDWGIEIDNWFATGLSFEGASPNPEGKNFTFRLSFTPGTVISAHLTYHKTNIGNELANDGGNSLFEFDTDDHIFLSVIRLKIIPLVFIKGYYSRIWLLENRSFENNYGFYEVVNMAGAGLEVGFDWEPHWQK
ncbi:MAG: hypothetical protein Kow0090_00550 [Myxococcota bacterium]